MISLLCFLLLLVLTEEVHIGQALETVFDHISLRSLYFTFDPGLAVNVNVIFTLRKPQV